MIRSIDKDTCGTTFFKVRYICSTMDNNDVVFTDMLTNCLYRYTLGGSEVFCYSGKNFVHPLGVAVDHDRNIYVCVDDSHTVHQIAEDGAFVKIILSGVDMTLSPNSPWAIGFDGNGTFFVTARDHRNVRLFRLA